MQWTGMDIATGTDSTVVAVVLNEGRRVVLLGRSSLNETTCNGLSIQEIIADSDKQEEEHFQPIVPTSIKFEQRKFDRHQAKEEYLRSVRLANNHFARRTKFRKLGRKKFRRS